MPPPLRCSPILPSSLKPSRKATQFRSFSTTLPQQKKKATRARRDLYDWLKGPGLNFKEVPGAGHTNYLGAYNRNGQLRRAVRAEAEKEDPGESAKPGEEFEALRNARYDEGDNDKSEKAVELPPETGQDLAPFPSNRHFRSQSVLSEAFRDKIWEEVMREGKSVRDVSAGLKVEMARVGAVVRLKEIEKEWVRIGKPLAKTYADAVMSMLPKSSVPKDNPKRFHESINDLPIHPLTGPQIFHPTSESRVFTRADAAKVFDEHLLPADDRIPHPELTLMQKDYNSGMTKKEVEVAQAARDEAADKQKQLRAERRAKRKGPVKVISTPRWEFRFSEANVDDAGRNGRGPNAVGWRYGFPNMDRSRGQHKIPKRVAG